jgi:hypothetical protein
LKLHNYLVKKEILFAPETSKEELIRCGDQLLEARCLHDAVSFYAQAGHVDGLKVVRRMAIEEGDFCLFRETLEGVEGQTAEPQAWSRLAEQAEAAGRWHDAIKAYNQCRDEKGLKRAKQGLERIMSGISSQARSSQQDGKGAKT